METQILLKTEILGTEVKIIETDGSIELCCPAGPKAAVQEYLENEGILDDSSAEPLKKPEL